MNINKGHDWDHANKSGRHAVLAALDTYDRQIASREG
jgi:hypothetical protein